MSDNKAHSKVGASSMHRWGNCPGSVKMCEGIPPQTSKYAEEGTIAHELAAAMLSKVDAVVFPNTEMKEHVLTYVNWVVKEANEATELLVEHKFSLAKIHPDAFGTADAVLYYADKKLLRVADFKYGQGIAVEVDDNEQLKFYALGAMMTLPDLKVDEVELVIVQPRAYHEDGAFRFYRFNSISLIDFSQDLREKIEATQNPNAPLKSGDWCRFCPAAGICPELSKKAQSLAKLEFSKEVSYDASSLKKALEAIPQIKAWCESVHEFAYNEALAGRMPEGFKLVEKRAIRKWRDENSVVDIALKSGLGDDDLYEKPKIKSPAQLEKTVGKNSFNLFFAPNVVQESSGLVLVPEEDKRKAVSPSDSARKDFSSMSDENLLT